jgi:hypothetical protein
MRAPLTAMAGLAAVAALGSGCGDPARGNLDLKWTFGGQSCLAAGVHTIQVDIAHELLTPNQFSCDLGGGAIAAGANLGTYLAGRYTLTISGLAADGAILYQTQQDVAVQRGDNVIQIDVQRVPGGSISLNWTFGGRTCAQAGVTSVRISVDGVLITDQAGNVDVACSAGGVDGTSISPLSPGVHRVDLVGIRSGQPSYALPNVQVSVADRMDTNVRVDLPPAQPTFATADVSWDALASGGGFVLGKQGAMTCDEAQVDVVRIALDPNLDGTGGTVLAEVACRTNGVEGAQVSPIPAGSHSFAITGIRNLPVPTLVYQTKHPPSARFELGLLSNVDVAADPVGSGLGSATLNWDFTGLTAACPVTYTLTDPSGGKTIGSASCDPSRPGTPQNTQLFSVASGLWSVDAAAGAFQSHVLFAVPNQSSAPPWKIPFSR